MGTHLEHRIIRVTNRNRTATNSELMRLGIDDWADDEDTARSHNCRAGKGLRTQPMTEEQAYQFAYFNYETASRDSYIIPLVNDFTVTEKNVKHTVTGEQLTKLLALDLEAVEELHRAMRKEHGNSVVRVEPIQFPKPRKAVAKATEGKTVTEYRVMWDDTFHRREVGVALGATQSEAREKALAIMNENQEFDELYIVPVVRRESGDQATVRITRPVPETATITVKLTTHALKKKHPETDSFMVVFAVHT